VGDGGTSHARHSWQMGTADPAYSRLIDFVYHSTLDFRVIKKKKKTQHVNLKIVGQPA